MSKRASAASLSSLPGFAPRGSAAAVPEAAVSPPPQPPPEPPRVVRAEATPRAAKPPPPPPPELPTIAYRRNLGLRLDHARYEQLRVIAFRRRQSVQQIFEELLDELLEREGEA